MKNLITDEMVTIFNNLMHFEGSYVELVRNERDCFDIQFPKDKFIKSSIINLTDEFYKKLELFFIQQGVPNLRFNNMGSTFWSYGEWSFKTGN